MNIDQLKSKIFDIISKEIIYLKQLDSRIIINKKGKFHFFELPELTLSNTFAFINDLQDNKVYNLFPMISANNKTDEPYIILSQSILVTNKNNPLELNRFIWKKCLEAGKLYNIAESTEYSIILKYKAIEMTFKPQNNFS